LQSGWKFSGSKSETLLFISLLYIAAVMPFQKPEVPVWPGVALMVIAWLFSGNLKNKAAAFIADKRAIAFASLYIIYITGFFYSENKDYALTDLLLKIPLLLFPLVISSSVIKEKKLFLLKTFLFASLISAVFSVLRSAYFTYTTGENYFYYYKLSWFFHVGHYAMYLAFAAFIAWYFFFSQKDKTTFLRQSFYIFCFVFLSVVVILLSARAQIVSFFAATVAGTLLYFVNKQNRVKALAILSLLVIISAVSVYTVPGTRERFRTTLNELQSFFVEHKKENYELYLRFAIWETGVEVIRQHPVFGVGTGDAKDKLLEEARNKGYNIIAEKNLNYHNQYIQTMAAIGLPGLLLLLGSIISGFVYGIRKRDYLCLSFFTIIVISFFTESMLERQAGVIFYSFFSALLIFADREKDVQNS